MKARKKKKLLKEAWMNLARKLDLILLTEDDRREFVSENVGKVIDEHRQKNRNRRRK